MRAATLALSGMRDKSLRQNEDALEVQLDQFLGLVRARCRSVLPPQDMPGIVDEEIDAVAMTSSASAIARSAAPGHVRSPA